MEDEVLAGLRARIQNTRWPEAAPGAPWDYVDNRWLAAELSLTDAVTVPTAVAVFAHQFIDDGAPSREWAERLYDIRRWTPMPSGGHFPSAEQPDLLGRDIAAFFNDLGPAGQHAMTGC